MGIIGSEGVLLGNIKDEFSDFKKQIDVRFLKFILEKATIFRDQVGDLCASFVLNGHMEVQKCDSARFKSWIGGLYLEMNKKVIGSEKIGAFILQLGNYALPEVKNIEYRIKSIYNSNAQPVEIHYDLCTDDWTTVKITTTSIAIEPHTEFTFKRNKSQLPQVMPNISGDEVTATLNTLKLLEFTNFKTEEDKLLFIIALIVAFIPNIARPIFLFYGQQGSAKSTVSRICKMILDPSAIDTASMPKEESNIVQLFNQHYAIFFDNVSGINTEKSDILCRAVTGGGFAKRELYTNDETVIFVFKRVIGMNGIKSLVNKPDLLDRSIMFELDRIDPKNRKTEKEFWQKFNESLPDILGGIFKVLQQTIVRGISNGANYEKDLPRMADFAMWGSIVADVLGFGKDKFLEIYKNNLTTQNETLIEESSFASCFVRFMELKTNLSGLLKDVWLEFDEFASDKDKKQRFWPTSSVWFSRRIKEFKTSFHDLGWEVDIYKKNTGSYISFCRVGESQLAPNESVVVIDDEQTVLPI